MATARSLLSYVLYEAREMLARSPEQVGAAVGVSGRTIRRLEDPNNGAQPRHTTLGAVATFYGLDPQFIAELADGEEGEEATLRWLREQAGARAEEFADRPDEARQLALLLSRGAPRGSGASDPAETAVMAGFGSGKSHMLALVTSRMQTSLSGSGDDFAEVGELVEAFLGLDRRRRRLALALLGDLRAARDAERQDS